jgi:hypothetical protein
MHSHKLLVFLCFFGLTTLAWSQDYVNRLGQQSDFDKLKGKPLSDKFSNVESVKTVYDIHNNQLYFFNSKKIELHYIFVNNYLGFDMDLERFNDRNYGSNPKERDFLLGNLNHVKGSDKWILELAASDHMDITQIELFYNLVKEATFIGDSLQFYLNNREKIEWREQQKFHIPCVTSEYIFNAVKYQEVVRGKAVGILKSYTLEELEHTQPRWDEIIILNGTPKQLPNVQGILVNELQTPLSHLVLLGKNRKVPVMAYTDVFKNSGIQNLLGKKVKLEIEVDTFHITQTTLSITKKNKPKTKALPMNLSVKEIISLQTVPKKGASYLGSKAQNLSFLIAIAKKTPGIFTTPEQAYALPFYFYHQHIQQKKIKEKIDRLLAYPYKDSILQINAQLKAIRKAIKNEPINPILIAKLQARLGTTSFTNYRFRSSTNAEDIDGFNGAGLYDSKTGIVNDSIKSFEKAIKDVWASTWNESSYWEREVFGISQQQIAMGVLIHRAFPDEIANGVVITDNLFRDEFPGITVNVQLGDHSVVQPEKGEICEQFTVYHFDIFNPKKEMEVDYTAHSNLNHYQPLMSREEIKNLYKAAKLIETNINKYWKKFTVKPIDIEFKIVGPERRLYIKQVRVFNPE